MADEGDHSVTLLMLEGGHAIVERKISAIEGYSIGLSIPTKAVRGKSPVEEIYCIADRGNGRVVKVRLESGQTGDPSAVWEDLRDALATGDIERAVSHFSPMSRAVYSRALTELADRLAEVAADMTEIYPLEKGRDRATYGVLRYEDQMPFLYNVEFVRDETGDWKILNW